LRVIPHLETLYRRPSLVSQKILCPRQVLPSGEDFASFAWGIAGGKPIQNTGAVQASTPLSEKMSKALKVRGFKFVGPVIVYAWMQAVGIVNDHSAGCFRRKVVLNLAKRGNRQ
jgi:3-methyladenine DNA glycosylase Tag